MKKEIIRTRKELFDLKTKIDKIYTALSLSNADELYKIKSFDTLCQTVYLLYSTQKRSAIIKNWIDKYFEFEKVPASKNKGNSFNKNTNEYFSVKISFLNDNNAMNIRQIRTWQNFQYYILVYIDPTQKSNCRLYKISKEDIDTLTFHGGSNCHGTKLANMDNRKVEKSLSFSIEDKFFDKYRILDIEKEWFES